jgi:hypothetical protein
VPRREPFEDTSILPFSATAAVAAALEEFCAAAVNVARAQVKATTQDVLTISLLSAATEVSPNQ